MKRDVEKRFYVTLTFLHFLLLIYHNKRITSRI